MRGTPFDRRINPAHDITCIYGFTWCAIIVASVVVGGVAWIAPECASWLYAPSRYMKRRASNGYEGDISRRDVREANVTARAVGWLVAFATARDVRVVVENPPNSNLWKFPDLLKRLQEAKGLLWTTYGGAFGFKNVKPLGLYSTVPADLIEFSMVRERREAQQRVGPGKQNLIFHQPMSAMAKAKAKAAAKANTAPKGRGRGKAKAAPKFKTYWKTGSKRAMRESSVYTDEFGDAAAQMIRSMFAA